MVLPNVPVYVTFFEEFSPFKPLKLYFQREQKEVLLIRKSVDAVLFHSLIAYTNRRLNNSKTLEMSTIVKLSPSVRRNQQAKAYIDLRH